MCLPNVPYPQDTAPRKVMSLLCQEIATYLIETPKHLMAIAASKKTAACGNVISATAKNEDLRWGAFAAHRESR